MSLFRNNQKQVANSLGEVAWEAAWNAARAAGKSFGEAESIAERAREAAYIDARDCQFRHRVLPTAAEVADAARKALAK